MQNEVLKELAKPFDLKARQGVGGKTFKYVPSEDIVDRMNKVFQGNWSTEVIKEQIIEDQILMCVRVSVTDNDGKKIYWHEGYASHPLARYTSGPNEGKIMDVGNSYKSAMSKAIKTACTKWGVALYLEGRDEDSDDKDMPSAGEITTVATSIPNIPRERRTEAAPLNIPAYDIPISQPTYSNTKPVTATRNVAKPVFTNENIVPSDIPIMDVPFNVQPKREVKENPIESPVEKLTSVQQVAIESIMENRNIRFNDLVAQALKGKGTLPPTINDVTYLEAVAIIQYGNHLRPGQN